MKKILLLILLAAAILRFVGAKPGFNQFHSDQGISYSAATSMIKNKNLDPLRYDYPALVPDINYIFFRSLFIPLGWAQYYLSHIPEILDGTVHIPIAPLERQRIFQVYILAEREINAIFWSRYVTALFGVGSVLLTFILGKKIFGSGVGLISALLLTFNFKHVINSHLGLPDIYNSFFMLLTFLAAFRIWKKPSVLSYVIGGIAAGLSFSTKYQIFAIFPIALANYYQGKLFNSKVFLAAISFVLVFLLTNPYFFIHLDKALTQVSGVALKYGMGTNKITLYPLWYLYNIDLGAPQLLAMFVGLFWALKRKFKETLLLLSFVAPFAFVLFYYSSGGFYVRNLITVTPALLIFASYFAWRIILMLKSKLLISLFLLTLLFIPARNSIIGAFNYTRQWPYEQMGVWIKNNFKTNDTVAAHPFDAVQTGLGKNRTEFEIAGSFSMAEHREAGASYALLNLYWAGNPFYYWMSGLNIVKPLEVMRNTYHGIAAEEMFRYQIHSVTKPWQASDQNLLLIKIPDKPNANLKTVSSFKFDKGLSDWKEVGATNAFTFSDTGSIIFAPGGKIQPGSRITSPFIEIKPGHLYVVEAKLRSEKFFSAMERDGFVRIDFYEENTDPSKLGITSSVSSRVYGTDDWVKKEVFDVAPANAHYLTVSFGMYNFVRGKVWFDDVNISESIDVVPQLNSEPVYIKKDIDLNLLYPNSHGNL